MSFNDFYAIKGGHHSGIVPAAGKGEGREGVPLVWTGASRVEEKAPERGLTPRGLASRRSLVPATHHLAGAPVGVSYQAAGYEWQCSFPSSGAGGRTQAAPEVTEFWSTSLCLVPPRFEAPSWYGPGRQWPRLPRL